MSFAALLILAAAVPGIAPVQPISPNTWVTNDDHQGKFRSMSGQIELALAVDPSGKTVRCEIVHPTGFPELDRYTCALVMARSRFKPARDQDGNTVAGRFSPRFRWSLDPNFKGKSFGPDVVLTVSKLPKIGPRSYIQAQILMSASATPEACKLDENVKDRRLEAVVCPVLMGMKDLSAVIDAVGTPVRGVRNVTVGFTLVTK